MPAARGQYSGGSKKKVRVRAPAFKPLPTTTKPFAAAQRRAKVKVSHAEAKLPKQPPGTASVGVGVNASGYVSRVPSQGALSSTRGLSKRQIRGVRRLRSAGKTGGQNIHLGPALKRLLDPYRNNVYLPSTGGGPSLLTPHGAASIVPGVVNLKGTAGGKILRNAINDAIDLPAGTVTSAYYIGKQAATGHPLKAGEALLKPVADVVKNPGKSLVEHPLNTVLIGRGIKGAVGHGVGGTMRRVPIESVRRAASTEREAKIVPGTAKTVRRQYSKDITTKGVQVVMDRRARAKRVKRGQDPRPVASVREINRAVDEGVQAAKIVTQHNQSVVAERAREAIAPKKGRGPRGRVKPTAATTLAVQGVVDTSKADLAKYLDEVKAKAPALKGKALQANQRTQGLLEDALKDHDPAAIGKAVDSYTRLTAELEKQVVDRGLVPAAKAEEARLAGAQARRVKKGASPETARVRKAANKTFKNAKRVADRAKANLSLAETAAREANTGRGVPPVQHDALLKAIDRNDRAQQALEVARQNAHQARSAHTRASLPPGVDPAYVSHQPIRVHTPAIPTKLPEPPVKARKTGQAIKQGSADVHPAKLVEQVVDTQRLIDASREREQFVGEWSYQRDGKPARFGNSEGAKNFAEKQLAGQWKPIRNPDGEYSLIPQDAFNRLKAHEENLNAQHPLLRSAGTVWRRNVLGFSPRWLTGNLLEAGLRSLIAHAGPTSYLSAKRYLGALPDDVRRQVEARTIGGGNFAQANRIAEDPYIRRGGEDLGKITGALYRLRQAPGPKQLADAYGAYTNFVFRSLNGRLETQFQTAMLGKALRDHPLMSRRVLTLSKQAVEEAAQGLKNTDVQAELGRLVDDMYGRYGKFSPGLRGAVANYTPFIAWTLNATNFLYRVLPRDHPVLTGLLASANVASEEWRKQNGLFLDFWGKTTGQKPGWLMGSIPGQGGSSLRLSRYTPFGLMDSEGAPIVGQISGLVLPQFSEAMKNAAGKDWMDKPLSSNPSGARDALAAVASIIEGQVPAASLATSIAGVRLPNQRDSQQIEPSLKVRARKQLDPFAYTQSKVSSSSSSSRRVRAPSLDWGGSSSSVDWGDSSSTVDWGS